MRSFAVFLRQDSTSSENGPSIQRTSSLPNNSLDGADTSRLCHVTLWDNSTAILFAKKSEGGTIRDALGELCERRGIQLSKVEVFHLGDYKERDMKLKRPISLDLDLSLLGEYFTLLLCKLCN